MWREPSIRMVWLARLSWKERFLVFVEEWVHSMARWMSHQGDYMSVLSSEYLAIFFLSAFLSVLSRRRCICAHRNIFPLSSIFFSVFSLFNAIWCTQANVFIEMRCIYDETSPTRRRRAQWFRVAGRQQIRISNYSYMLRGFSIEIRSDPAEVSREARCYIA